LAWHAIAKAPLDGKPLSAALAFVKMIVRAVGVDFIVAHQSRGLLANQKCAERRVPKCVERHCRVSFGNPLAKNAGNPAIDVVHHKRRCSKVSNNILEQRLHRCWLACIAGVSADAMRSLETLQDEFIRVPGGDADTHAVFGEELGATRADAGTAPDNKSNVLYGRANVRFGSSHVPCSRACH
jgi:hypothetical protein